VLIRPRPGDFHYSDFEFEAMQEDVLFCRKNRVDGIVTGILNDDGTVDMKRTEELIRLANPMRVTFHRAFDMTRDPFQAMEHIIELGIERILTSGQAPSAFEGTDLISELVAQAENRILIMPGGGINENNVTDLIKRTGAKEVHASMRSPAMSRMQYRNDAAFMGMPGQDEYTWMETDVERVREMARLLIASR